MAQVEKSLNRADPAGEDKEVSEPMECWTCGLDKTGQMHSAMTTGMTGDGKCKIGTMKLISSAGF